MRKIVYLLGDLFKDDNRPIEDTSAGFLEHNTLLQDIADPDGRLTLIKSQTQALAMELTTCETAIGKGQAQQHGGRELTQAEYDKVMKIIRENESALRNRYVVKDAELRKRLYDLWYANKLVPYNAANLKTMPGIVRTYLEILEDEKGSLPKDFYEETVKDLTPFAETRSNQQKQINATQKAIADRQLLLPRLTEQLTANLHELCVFYRTDKMQVLTYFNPRYFEVQVSARPGHYTARVATRHTNQVLDVLDAQQKYTKVKLAVKESIDLCFYRGDDSQTPPPAEPLLVSKGSPVTLPLAELPGSGALLLVRNATAYVGHYVVDLS
ncbi:hypothetical protein Q5H93_00325 [Hymenobacter sp. ASUV-10]|uniref:Uncharacterized protein n=1 Tax=Hymenobacter aranciens TaxID=3063996 RepID=A0ABT9B5T9_9BACT|nr:hypothetical protein [Hymenobacter sp. ASUV-10]MDO7873160.1 hypothetical protein [Hymenobacter sp. ASUV-10]